MSNPNLSLHVRPGIWTDPHFPRPSIPYQEVVAVEDIEHEATRISGFAALGTDRIEATTPTEFSSRLMSLFKAYRGASSTTERLSAPNCHWLAHWMNGDDRSTLPTLLEGSRDIMQAGCITDRNLKIGEIGVYGVKYDGLSTPLHAVVGFDESTGLCIQLKSQGGPVALTKQTDMTAYYDALTSELWGEGEYSEHGLYVATSGNHVK